MHYYKTPSIELPDGWIMIKGKLGATVDLFLSEYKATTAQSYKLPLVYLIEHFGENSLLHKIDPPALIDYLQVVIRPRDYAAATYRKHVKTIKCFFNWCVRMGYFAKSPAGPIKVPPLPRRLSREKAMTDAELEALLKVLVEKRIPKDYATVLFLAETGCRMGGVNGVRIGDIDFEHNRARVTEKGGKTRPVAFSPRCAEAIQRWLTYRARHYTVKGDYVFTKYGAPQKAEQISQNIRRACQKAGIRTLSAHSLRHRLGHKFADARIAPSIAATALGHENVGITLQHYYPTDWDTAEKALRELMLDGGTTTPPTPPAPPPTPRQPAKPAAPVEPAPEPPTSSKIIQFPGRSA